MSYYDSCQKEILVNTCEMRGQSCLFSQTNQYSSLKTNQYSSPCLKRRLQYDCADAHSGLCSWSFNVGKDNFACDTLDVAMIFGSLH